MRYKVPLQSGSRRCVPNHQNPYTSPQTPSTHTSMDDCPICLEALDRGSTVLPCGHTIHKECMQNFLRFQPAIMTPLTPAPKCPICRTSIPIHVRRSHTNNVVAYGPVILCVCMSALCIAIVLAVGSVPLIHNVCMCYRTWEPEQSIWIESHLFGGSTVHHRPDFCPRVC